MKNSYIPYIFLCFFGLWNLGAIPVGYAQDVSINIISVPATLPLSTTGTVQVDLCNTDPTNTSAPVDKLRPQISVGSNVTILGVTNSDGSPLTNFTVLSNTGQIVSLSNSVPLANLDCLSFKIIVRGTVIDSPGNVGDIVALLNPQTSDNKTFNDNSTSSVAVIANPGPDLAPITFVLPSVSYGTTPINVVVDVLELNSVTSSEVITVKLVRDSRLFLNFNPTASLIGGRSVQNSDWNFDNSDSDFYVLTTKQAFPAHGKISFGLSGVLSPGNTSGVLSIGSVVAGSVGELNIFNNADAEVIHYFNK
ncbi:hypothetical protein [Spirosoma endophyticum]|uniref:Uncharacterized protein n=1 Tax=Spirosoma endophyticum TaxID=662367 RepID=A0A1I1WAK6_9BACT|nr:hypothetical protein [Spirosoma endophyticum]SFD91428.1 hypothetical protein SAMN05216167_108176 [Spirosoma endophyticum]